MDYIRFNAVKRGWVLSAVDWSHSILHGYIERGLATTHQGGCMADRVHLLALQGATASAIQLFDRLLGHPVITMQLATRLLETSKPTAAKAIELLIAAGILAEGGERKRDLLYRYQNFLQLLE